MAKQDPNKTTLVLNKDMFTLLRNICHSKAISVPLDEANQIVALQGVIAAAGLKSGALVSKPPPKE